MWDSTEMAYFDRGLEAAALSGAPEVAIGFQIPMAVDLAHTVLKHGYLVVFLAMAAESTLVAGLILPGMAVMFTAAFLSGSGELQVSLVLLAAILGTMVGDTLGYALGRFGRKLRAVHKVSNSFRATSQRMTGRYPLHYYFFQFPMPLRVAFPILAGTLDTRFTRWLRFDIMATLLFVSTLTAIGYTVGRIGENLGFADHVLGNLNTVLIGAFLVWLVLTVSGLLLRRRREHDQRIPAVDRT